MAEFSPQQAADIARAAAGLMRQAADAAQDYADATAAAALAAAAGGVDPFVFRFSIFVLAVFVGYFVVWSVWMFRAHLRLGEHIRRLPGHPAHARHVSEKEQVTPSSGGVSAANMAREMRAMAA
jgi:hypothetical protein